MGFPKELREKKIWVCWRLTPDKDGGKDRKVPFNPATGKAAKSNDPNTWATYEQAQDAYDRYGYTGTGFMFWEGTDVVGVDIDHCYDKETGQFNEVAQAVMQKQPTYMEFSPSGTGIHLLYHGKKPSGACKNSAYGIEMYDGGRYFTATGRQIEGSSDEIAEGTDTLAWIHETYLQKQKKGKEKKAKTARKAEPLTDEEVLEKAKSAGDQGIFSELFDGKWEGRYGSQSEADMALCLKLAFWTGKDAEQMDRLFRQSKLYREKWDQAHRSDGTTYGQETIGKAVEMQEDVYSPGKDTAIFEYDGRYFRAKIDQVYPLTNFIVEPIEMVESEEETQMTANLVVGQQSFKKTMLSTDFTSGQKFKGMLNRTGIALGYFGGDADLEILKIFLSDLDWKKKKGVSAVGTYSHGGRLVYVGGDVAVDKDGSMVEDILQIERTKEITSGILETEPITKEKFLALGKCIMSYNEPAKTVPILAWAAGCFVKEHLRMKRIKYPLLFLIGEAGSGKSTTMEKVLLPVFSETKVYASSQMTRFTLMRISASSNLPPMFLDEFKPSKMNRTYVEALQNHFRDTYDGHEGSRGRMDQQMRSYDLLAPIAVAGEESADESAIRERSVELLFSKKDLKVQNYRKAFIQLADSSEILEDFGRSLLMTALSTDPDTVAGWHRDAAEMFDSNLPERVRNNLRGAYCGLKLIEKLCVSLGLGWDMVFPYSLTMCSKFLETSAKDYLLDGGTHNQSVVDETFEIMSRMSLDPKNDYQVSEDGTLLYIRLAKVYDDYTRYRKDYAISGEVLGYKEFRKQLQHSDLFVAANQQKRMGEKNQKVWVLRLDTMGQRCDVSGFMNDEIKPLV